jgi:hypothetical protein
MTKPTTLRTFLIALLGGCAAGDAVDMTRDAVAQSDLAQPAGSSPDLGSCSTNESCPPGLSCIAGTCEPPETAPVVNLGGEPLAAMEVWTVVWKGDETVGEKANQFHRALFGSSYWSTHLSEYGVGPAVAKGVIVLGAPPASLNDPSGNVFDTLVASLIGMAATDGSTVPQPNKNTVFAFIVSKASAEPGGYYHTETNSLVSGIHVPYIVDRQDDVHFVTPEQYFTWCDSHELAETASNPHPSTHIAWSSPWLPYAGEIGDLCNDIPTSTTLSDGNSYMLTRIYSAKAAVARAGDPCQPSLAYSNVGIVPGEVKVPRGVGQSVTIQLVPFSYGSAASMHWHLYVDPSYAASPEEGTATPGDPLTVTLTRNRTSPQYPTTLQIWVTDPAKPDAEIPQQEWIGAISPI